jgi:ABC-type nitrate/sulfonate/bicarbonate transport system substrate-binding protein
MMKIILALLTLFVLHAVACAADKITIGVPELNAQFVPLALAEKKGFFREVGIQADVIRINPTVALAALVSGELDYWTVSGALESTARR